MAILSGLISADMPVELIARRKDFMIESAAYDIIKNEGFQERIQKGITRVIAKTDSPDPVNRFLDGVRS